MFDLYISILAISEGWKTEIANEKLDLSRDTHIYQGFEFKILYYDDTFLQLSIYTYDPYPESATVFGISIDNTGIRVGTKYNVPMLLGNYGTVASISRSYVFMISKMPISREFFNQVIGIDESQKISQEAYHRIAKRLAVSKRINAFEELMHYIDRDFEKTKLTDMMIQNTKVYEEDFKSSLYSKKKGVVRFYENLTLSAAKSYVDQRKRVAVLNFANPVEPGGGVFRGAKAQEESLCRAGNLYKSLISENAIGYYRENQDIIGRNQFNSMFIGTDKVIYSPNVMILKEYSEDGPETISYGISGTVSYSESELILYDGAEMYLNQPYFVDVITCAAPFFSGSGYILPNGDLQHLFKRRIRNIFEVAIENQVEVLILGAFGCGAFHNPPDVVADAFREILLEERYINAFDEIVFAVKRTEIICPNIEAFEYRFSMFPKLNENGREKEHRLLWKWVCDCGMEHHWDKVYCEKCNSSRKNKKVIAYNGQI